MEKLACFMGIGTHANQPVFDLAFAAVLTCIVIAAILWQRRYQRMWQQWRARNWERVPGKFDEGDIVTMHKGGTSKIAGYEVWFAYDYQSSGEQVGIFTLPFRGEFPTQQDAEQCRRMLAGLDVPVRVSSWNPKRSRVLDEDIISIIGPEHWGRAFH